MHRTLRPLLISIAGVVALAVTSRGPAAEPIPLPERLREEWKLDRHYQKGIDAGIPVVGSARVSDHALAETAWLVGRLLGGRPDLLRAMRDTRVRVAVMAADEYTTDLPDHRSLRPKLYWDRRARGLGATPTNPAVSCGEENLLGHPGDPYPDENIFIHEFAHAIHGTGLNTVDPTFDRRLRAAHRAAVARGLWRNTYAATNPSEYWAEGVQCWFDDNAPPDALHNDVRTRVRLKEYDPELAALCREVFDEGEWRYQRPAKRSPDERRHLVGYDPERLPRFGWRKVPVGERPRATIQTAVGDFDVELDPRAAPEAVAVFLDVALDGGYHSGRFLRRVPDEAGAETGAIRATVRPRWLEQSAKRLSFPMVPRSAARPADGTLALVRGGAGPGEFVVFVGTPPADVGDLVPFGRVTRGADVVRKVWSASADGEKSRTGVDIRRVIRTE